MMPPMPSVRQGGTGRGGTGGGTGSGGGAAGNMRGAMSRGEYGKQLPSDWSQLPSEPLFLPSNQTCRFESAGNADAGFLPFHPLPQLQPALGLQHLDFIRVPPEMGHESDWYPATLMLTLTQAY